MKAVPPPRRIAVPLNADVLHDQKKPIQSLLNPLLDLAENSDYLIAGSAGEFAVGAEIFQIPRFIFMGPGGGGDTVRMGIFAAIHGDESEGAEALVEFLQELERDPQAARGYHLYIYPLCNPTGFTARTRNNVSDKDLSKDFWRGSSQPEVYYLEREMGVLRFQGVISVHTQSHSKSFSLNVNSSAILSHALAKPVIQAAQRFPSDVASRSDGDLPPTSSHVVQRDFLTRGCELNTVPFELHLGIPRRALKPSQINGTVGALKAILDSYRALLSIGQNI